MSVRPNKVYITEEKLTWYVFNDEKNILYYDTGVVEKLVQDRYSNNEWIQDTIKTDNGITRTRWKNRDDIGEYPLKAMAHINPTTHKLEQGNPLIGIYAGKPFRKHLIIVGYQLFSLPEHKQIDKLLSNIEPLTYIKVIYKTVITNDNYKKYIYEVFTGDKADEIIEPENKQQISLFNFK